MVLRRHDLRTNLNGLTHARHRVLLELFGHHGSRRCHTGRPNTQCCHGHEGVFVTDHGLPSLNFEERTGMKLNPT